MKISITLLFITLSTIVHGQYVEDKAKFLTKKEIDNLNVKIQQIKNQTTGEILIYTTESLNGKEVKEAAKSIFSQYGIGKKGVNNGVLFFLAKEEAEIQILNGYGVEWIMSDKESKIIIDSMINYFKKGSFYNGLNYGLTKVGNKLSSVSWNYIEKPVGSISQKDEGKIIKFIMYKTPQTKIEYAPENGAQFQSNYKIKISSQPDSYLFYSHYMNQLLYDIKKNPQITIYARVANWKARRLELIGTSK